jgi:hypothetical protein
MAARTRGYLTQSILQDLNSISTKTKEQIHANPDELITVILKHLSLTKNFEEGSELQKNNDKFVSYFDGWLKEKNKKTRPSIKDKLLILLIIKIFNPPKETENNTIYCNSLIKLHIYLYLNNDFLDLLFNHYLINNEFTIAIEFLMKLINECYYTNNYVFSNSNNFFRNILLEMFYASGKENLINFHVSEFLDIAEISEDSKLIDVKNKRASCRFNQKFVGTYLSYVNSFNKNDSNNNNTIYTFEYNNLHCNRRYLSNRPVETLNIEVNITGVNNYLLSLINYFDENINIETDKYGITTTKFDTEENIRLIQDLHSNFTSFNDNIQGMRNRRYRNYTRRNHTQLPKKHEQSYTRQRTPPQQLRERLQGDRRQRTLPPSQNTRKRTPPEQLRKRSSQQQPPIRQRTPPQQLRERSSQQQGIPPPQSLLKGVRVVNSQSKKNTPPRDYERRQGSAHSRRHSPSGRRQGSAHSRRHSPPRDYERRQGSPHSRRRLPPRDYERRQGSEHSRRHSPSGRRQGSLHSRRHLPPKKYGSN